MDIYIYIYREREIYPTSGGSRAFFAVTRIALGTSQSTYTYVYIYIYIYIYTYLVRHGNVLMFFLFYGSIGEKAAVL